MRKYWNSMCALFSQTNQLNEHNTNLTLFHLHEIVRSVMSAGRTVEVHEADFAQVEALREVFHCFSAIHGFWFNLSRVEKTNNSTPTAGRVWLHPFLLEVNEKYYYSNTENQKCRQKAQTYVELFRFLDSGLNFGDSWWRVLRHLILADNGRRTRRSDLRERHEHSTETNAESATQLSGPVLLVSEQQMTTIVCVWVFWGSRTN